VYFGKFIDVSVKLAVFISAVYPDKSPDDGRNKLWRVVVNHTTDHMASCLFQNTRILDSDNTLCHGVMTDIIKSVTHVSTMERTGAQWTWPQKKQEIWYVSNEVLRKKEHKPDR